MAAATRARRILLALEHRGNRELLGGWLRRDAELAAVAGDERDDGTDLDVVVLDGAALASERDWLAALRERVRPVYVPALLVTRRQDATLLTRDLWRTVDDVVTTPVRPEELRARLRRLLVVRDLSLEAAARAAELERSNADLEEFAFVAAHELASPLTVVSGVVDTLRARYTDALDDVARLLLEEAGATTGRMHELIDDLLRYARAGRDLVEEDVDLGAVVAETLHVLADAVEAAGAEVVVRRLPTVRGDAVQLAMVVRNLLGNALKFTRVGVLPHVEVAAAREGETWVVTVLDNGIGVDPDQTEAIFAMFSREHGREDFPGTGIGLATCRKIVEHHGGTITAAAAPGGGTVVSFTLPA